MAGRSKRTLLWTSTSYFGEGLIWSFLHQLALEFLTAIGASKTQISSTSLLHLAGTFRFAWSPIVDLFGSKRRWVWMMQIVLAAGMFGIAVISRGGNLRLFWIAAGLLAVAHATHDVACDGFYLQALDRHGQALFSGTRNAAYRAAMWVGKSALVVLAGLTGWFWGFGAAAALMLVVAMVNAIVLPHPVEQHPQDAPEQRRRDSRAGAFVAAYRSFLAQPQAGVVLAFMFFHRLGDIVMFAMATPMLKDIGINTATRGVLTSFSTVGFMVGSIVGGAIIARWGLARCLVPMTYFQNLAIPLFIGLAVYRPGFLGVLPVVIAEQLASGIGNAANAVFLMQRCRRAFSAAHFAFATSVVSLASTLFGFFAGPLNEAVGHPWFFTIAFVASWPSMILVLLVPRTPLESDEQAPA